MLNFNLFFSKFLNFKLTRSNFCVDSHREQIQKVWLKKKPKSRKSSAAEIALSKKSQVYQMTRKWPWTLQDQSYPIYVPLVYPQSKMSLHFTIRLVISNIFAFFFHFPIGHTMLNFNYCHFFKFKFQNSKKQLLCGLSNGKAVNKYSIRRRSSILKIVYS